MGLRSKRERGSCCCWGGRAKEGYDEVEVELKGPRERDDNAVRSSIGLADDEAVRAAAGATSSKSKSIRLTCSAAFFAFVVDSVVANLARQRRQEVLRDKWTSAGVRWVDLGRRRTVSSFERFIPLDHVVDEIVHEEQPVCRRGTNHELWARVRSPSHISHNSPIAPGSFSALSAIHF